MDQLSTPLDDDIRRSRVLDGALKVFLSYGYKRATMDDIAQAAEMSRPALYLVFKNKADIYRAIGQRLFETCGAQVDAVMRTDCPLVERLDGALIDIMISLMCSIGDSPHGAELLDLKNELAVGMIDEWRIAVAASFRRAFEAEARINGVDLAGREMTIDGLADMLLDGVEAIKQRDAGAAEKKASARQLVRVVALALRP